MAASPLWGVLVASFISLAAPALVSATEEGRSTFDTQVGVARAALSAGNLDQALALGDAAIRMSPERWDGYAIAGQALLGLRQYEPAADALSKAIERAPDAQQGVLRDLRRECLVAESASPASSPAAPPTAPGALKASAPVASSNQGGMLPPSPRAIERPVATSQARPDPAVWLDASTGLMWARPWYYPKDGMAGPWNLSDAQSFCSMLDLGGYSHWRLPTVDELQHVFRVSSEGWRWSRPAFDPEYGIDEALEQKRWRPSEFVVGGDHFQGNRLLLWTSTPAEKPGEHVGMYFGNRYSVRDDQRLGSSFEGSARRTPYQGYALCMRSPG
jgi:tetratricopeptide (TPR) repeat protein